MTWTVCIVCDEPSPSSRCADHALRRPERDRSSVHWNRARWKTLSQRMRRMQPWCSACGARRNLTVDHIVPEVLRPDLAYVVANLDVLCRRCNGAKADDVSPEMIAEVERRIAEGWGGDPLGVGLRPMARPSF